MKTYSYKNRKVYIKYTTYANNGCLAVEMLSPDDEKYYDVITVNLNNCMMQGDTTAFVDTNNLPGIGKWLERHGIARPLGIYQQSGFCRYQLYAFNNA